jgi:hypothetical protein
MLGVGELGSWWMLSHLSDLFYHAGVVDDYFEFGQKREYFISHHVKSLMNQSIIFYSFCC